MSTIKLCCTRTSLIAGLSSPTVTFSVIPSIRTSYEPTSMVQEVVRLSSKTLATRSSPKTKLTSILTTTMNTTNEFCATTTEETIPTLIPAG